MPRTTVTDGRWSARTILLDTTVTIDANDAIVVRDHADRRRCARGVLDPVRAAGLPARSRPPATATPRPAGTSSPTTTSRQLRPVRDDHGLGRSTRLVQARRGESRPARPQASRRRIAGVVPDVRTRVRIRSGQRLRELPARRHAGRSHPDRRRGDQPPRARPVAERQLPPHVDAHHRAAACPRRRCNRVGGRTRPAPTRPSRRTSCCAPSSRRSTPAGNLVRDWDSTGEIALGRDHRSDLLPVPAATGDDYLSSIHPNAIDLKANGPGTADDQLHRVGPSQRRRLRDQLRPGDRRLEARRHAPRPSR